MHMWLNRTQCKYKISRLPYSSQSNQNFLRKQSPFAQSLCDVCIAVAVSQIFSAVSYQLGVVCQIHAKPSHTSLNLHCAVWQADLICIFWGSRRHRRRFIISTKIYLYSRDGGGDRRASLAELYLKRHFWWKQHNAFVLIKPAKQLGGGQRFCIQSGVPRRICMVSM